MTTANPLPTTELKRVTLYKNNLAFLERSAPIDTGARLDDGTQRAWLVFAERRQRVVRRSGGQRLAGGMRHSRASRKQSLERK